MTMSKPEFVYMTLIAGLKTLLETGEAVDFTNAEESDCPGQQAAANG